MLSEIFLGTVSRDISLSLDHLFLLLVLNFTVSDSCGCAPKGLRRESVSGWPE